MNSGDSIRPAGIASQSVAGVEGKMHHPQAANALNDKSPATTATAYESRPMPTAATDQALRTSELSYRRLFEAARDGILILDADTGRVTDVNPFLIELLGFSHDEMLGKTVGELSPFKDIVSNQAKIGRASCRERVLRLV